MPNTRINSRLMNIIRRYSGQEIPTDNVDNVDDVDDVDEPFDDEYYGDEPNDYESGNQEPENDFDTLLGSLTDDEDYEEDDEDYEEDGEDYEEDSEDHEEDSEDRLGVGNPDNITNSIIELVIQILQEKEQNGELSEDELEVYHDYLNGLIDTHDLAIRLLALELSGHSG